RGASAVRCFLAGCLATRLHPPHRGAHSGEELARLGRRVDEAVAVGFPNDARLDARRLQVRLLSDVAGEPLLLRGENSVEVAGKNAVNERVEARARLRSEGRNAVVFERRDNAISPALGEALALTNLVADLVALLRSLADSCVYGCGSFHSHNLQFGQRNRLIAAASQATVVLEAGWRSGSLNTAGHAAAIGRPLGAVPGPVTSAASAGCHRLIREFDARCVTNADEMAELAPLPEPRASADEQVPAVSTRDRLGVRMLDALAPRAARPVEEIARRAGLSVS